MKSLQTAYGVYFNKKYNRVGPLFGGRYKSIACQKDEHLLQVSKYIHLNSVTSCLCKKPLDYPYSSYTEYILGKNRHTSLNIIDKRSMRIILGGNISKKSIQIYRCFVEEKDDIYSYDPINTAIDIFGNNNRFVTKINTLDCCKAIFRVRP